MKQEILVPYITSTQTSLVSSMNENIRTMNVMISQLYWQLEKIEELKKEKEKYPAQRERRVRAIKDAEARYSEQCENVERLSAELEKLSLVNIAQRIKLSRELKLEQKSLEYLKWSLIRANHVLNLKDDHFNHIDHEIKSVHKPNFINHLSKFYAAHRSYQETAKQFEKLTGAKVPQINTNEIIKYSKKKDELPEVNVDFVIPRLELELIYDDVDEFENDNLL